MKSVREWRDLLKSGERVPKPRTNCDAINFWAAHALLLDSPANSGDTNSIVITRDVVYSFGHHYPMGVIVRNAKGRCIEIVLNADHYPVRGWANTPGDQWDVKAAADDVQRLDPRVRITKTWLSSFNLPHGIQIQPRDDDPEPPARIKREVPRRFTAHVPGPEPVDTGEGCIAGRVEEYSYQSINWMMPDQREPHENDHRILVRASMTNALCHEVWYNGTLVWGSEPHRPREDGVTYTQCPHCSKFQLRHRIWTVLMHGGYHPQTYAKIKGWDAYQANLHKYGGWEGWLEAWRADNRRVSEAREARAAWVKRNHVPLHCITHRANRMVPKLTADGYALRVDEEAYFKLQRFKEREARKLSRQHERYLRERAQVERFKSRVKARREAAHARTFEGTVQRVVDELRAIRESYHAIPELKSNESLED